MPAALSRERSVPTLNAIGQLAIVVTVAVTYWAFFHHLGDTGERHLAEKTSSVAAAKREEAKMPKMISPAELRSLSDDGKLASQHGIPLLLHQSHRSRRALKSRYREWMESWNRAYAAHDGWQHVFWTDEDNEALVARTLPWLLDTFRAYPHNIQRADISRIAVLREYGGVYADVDYECLRTGCLDTAFNKNCSVSIMEGPNRDVDGLFQNTLMISRNGGFAASFWETTAQLAVKVARNSTPQAWWGGVGAGSVLTSTGPGLLTRSYAALHNVDIAAAGGVRHSYNGKVLDQLLGAVPRLDSGVCRLSEDVFSGQVSGPDPKLLSMHHNAKSWVQDVHRRSIYLPRVLPCLLALVAAVFCVSHRVVVVPASLLFCYTAGFPSNKGDAAVGLFVVVLLSLCLCRSRSFREGLELHESKFWYFFCAASVIMYLAF